MTASFWLQYILALVVVGLMLGGLYVVVRGLSRSRVLLSSSNRLITVLETTMLSQHSSCHVIKAGSHYYLIGVSNGHVSTLGELPADEVDAWLEDQRSRLGAQKLTIANAIGVFRGKR
jgi:flagellar biogenesis protein FliO